MSHRVKERTVGKGRNDSCPCGSGKKYKKCCGANRAGKGGSPEMKRPIELTKYQPTPERSRVREAMPLLAMANSFMIDTTTRRIPRRIHPE